MSEDCSRVNEGYSLKLRIKCTINGELVDLNDLTLPKFKIRYPKALGLDLDEKTAAIEDLYYITYTFSAAEMAMKSTNEIKEQWKIYAAITSNGEELITNSYYLLTVNKI